MENSSLNWQDSLNPQLLQRLVLLGQEPGIIKQDIGQKIIDRCDRFLNRLPLLSQYLQRWQGFNEMSVNSVPIVYALPPLQELGNNERMTVNQVNHLASNTEKTIETKLESSQSPLVTINDAQEKGESVTENPIVVQLSTVNEISSPIEMPLSTNANSVMPLQESGKNENFTVNQVNNLASNTEKTIQTKTESSQRPSAASNYLTEKRGPNIANPIVVQPSTGNEIAPAIEMQLVTNSESLEAITTSNPIVVQLSTVNEIASPIEMPLSTNTNSVTPLQESEKNEDFTVNQVNNLVSNTEKTIQTKTESSQRPSAASNYLTEKREPNIANPIVVQPLTGNEIAPAIDMQLVTNSESIEAIATSSTPMASKPGLKNPESINNKNSISRTEYQTQYQIVYPLSIIDNFLSSNQTYSLINNILDPLPIAKMIDRSSNDNDLDRQHLIVNPLSQENSSQLLSQNKSIQECPLSRSLSSTNSSLVEYVENTQKKFNYFVEKAITENYSVQTTLLEEKLEQKKVKLPVVKMTNQLSSEKLENQLPMSPSISSKMPRINPITRVNSPAIATPLPLASRSSSLPSSGNFDVQRRSPQQSPEVPKVFAAPFPPTETRISPMQTAPPKVDLEAIAHQVERKIMRRLVIESERRGQKR